MYAYTNKINKILCNINFILAKLMTNKREGGEERELTEL